MTGAPLPSGEVQNNDVALSEASPPGEQDIQQTPTPPGIELFVKNVIANVLKDLQALANSKEQEGLFLSWGICYVLEILIKLVPLCIHHLVNIVFLNCGEVAEGRTEKFCEWGAQSVIAMCIKQNFIHL